MFNFALVGLKMLSFLFVGTLLLIFTIGNILILQSKIRHIDDINYKDLLKLIITISIELLVFMIPFYLFVNTIYFIGNLIL